jgi:hypothetical protein
VRFKVVVSDGANATAAHHQDVREARSCFNEGGVRILFSVTDAAARPMVFSRQQPSGTLVELFRSHADLIIDKEAAGSGGCSTTLHGRLGAGVSISIDAVPGVFNSGLIRQHLICSNLFSTGTGVQGSSSRNSTTAAATARIAKAVQQVYERFETACDDLDSGLFDLADRHCYRCMQFFGGARDRNSRAEGGHQVHGLQLPGARRGHARWPAPRVRDHRAPQQPLRGSAGCKPIRD